MKMLSRDHLDAVNDRPAVVLEVPEWEGAVYIRALSAGDRDTLDQHMIEQGDSESAHVTLRCKMVAMALVDHDGNRLYSDDEVAELSAKSNSAINHICKHVMEQNNLSPNKQDDLVGN